VTVLSECDDARAFPWLVAALKDDADHIREAAVQALRARGPEKALREIAPLVADASFDVRHAAIETLRAIGGPEVNALVRGFLTHEDDTVIVDALRILGDGDDIEGTREIGNLLVHASPQVRDAAAIAIRAAGVERDIEHVVALLNTPDDEAQRHVAWLLSVKGGEAAEAPLRRLFASGKPLGRVGAAVTLVTMGRTGAAQLFATLWDDPDATVRVAAWSAWCHLPDHRSRAAEDLARSPVAACRVARRLPAFAGVEAAELLVALGASTDASVRRDVRAAVGRLLLLEELFDDPDYVPVKL
jgi:HEAT repeat protein